MYRRAASYLALASFFSACMMLFAQLAAGDLKPEIGDWSVRYLSAIDYAGSNPFNYLFSKNMLTAIWPPGHTAFYQMLLAALDPKTPEDAFFTYSTISILFWGAGVAAAYFLARLTMPSFFALLAVPLTLACPMMLRYSYSGMTDMLSVSLFLIATLLIVLSLTKDRMSLALLAGLVMLFASTMRHEVMVYSFILFLYLLFVKRIKSAFVYGVLAGGLPTLRVIYAFTFDRDNASNFIRNNRRDLNVADPTAELITLFSKVVATEAFFLTSCAIIIGLASAALLASFFRTPPTTNALVGTTVPKGTQHGAVFCVISASIIAVLLASTLSGSSISHARYALPALPFIGLASLWIAALFFRRLGGAARLTGIFKLPLICVTMIAFVHAQLQFQENRPRFLPQDEELISWLKTKNAGSVFFDYLDYKEFPIHAMLQSPGQARESWMWATHSGPKRTPPEELRAFERTGDRITFDAHSYIVDAKPRYLILASDQRHETIVARSGHLRRLIPHRFRDSYVRPFLAQRDDVECLVSPYVKEAPCFRVSFTNQDFKILENLNGNLLNNQNVPIGPGWSIEGAMPDPQFGEPGPFPRTFGTRLEVRDPVRLLQNVEQRLSAGSEFEASVWLWTDGNPISATLGVHRAGAGEYEGTNIEISVDTEPRLFKVSHVFQQDQSGVRFFVSFEEGPVLFWQAQLFSPGP